MNEPKKVTAAILRKEGKILIAKRQSGDAFEGRWEFPGGKIEEGETPEQCLRRELFEEFGICTHIGDLLYIVPYTYTEVAISLYAFDVALISGEIELHVHQEVKYVEQNDLNLYDFLEADRLIIEQIIGDNHDVA